VGAHAPKRVLETAAGTGIVARKLRDALPRDATLVVTDLNDGMLACAKEKFAEGEHVEFQAADATSLPFADASFDALVCQFGIIFYPDEEAGVREAARVLRRGGRFHFNVWDSIRHNPVARIANELALRLYQDDTPPFYGVPVRCSQAALRIFASRSSVSRKKFRTCGPMPAASSTEVPAGNKSVRAA
jgi:ubiquinone/menaquinone biosynthesis C-methylase UbiE